MVDAKFGPAGPLLNTEQIKRQVKWVIRNVKGTRRDLLNGRLDKASWREKKKERDEITVGVWRTNASLRGCTKRTSHSHKVTADRNRVRPPCPGNQVRVYNQREI